MTLYEMIEDVKAEAFDEGVLIGEERGMLEGAQQKAYETAKTMLFDELPIETIVKYTGLSYEQIEEIADELDAEI